MCEYVYQFDSVISETDGEFWFCVKCPQPAFFWILMNHNKIGVKSYTYDLKHDTAEFRFNTPVEAERYRGALQRQIDRKKQTEDYPITDLKWAYIGEETPIADGQ